LKSKVVASGNPKVLAAICLVSLILIAYGAIVFTSTVSASHIVTRGKLGIYSNSACTQKITSIDWGPIPQGNSTSKIVYVKNLGTIPLRLSMSNANLNPTSANGSIALSWNRENTILSRNQATSANITLSIASKISTTTNFNMQIVISGTG
jgi:hypothetical protein